MAAAAAVSEVDAWHMAGGRGGGPCIVANGESCSKGYRMRVLRSAVGGMPAGSGLPLRWYIQAGADGADAIVIVLLGCRLGPTPAPNRTGLVLGNA